MDELKQSKRDRQLLEDWLSLKAEEIYETDFARKLFDILEILVIAVDLNGEITMANNKAAELLEEPREGIAGKKWTDFFAPHIDREQFEIFLEHTNEMDASTIRNKQYIILTPSEKQKIIEASLTPIRSKSKTTGFLIVGEDRTEQFRLQAELEKSLKRYRMLASNIPETNLYLFDNRLQFIIAEGSDMKKLGLTPGYFEGKNLKDLFDRETRDFLVPLYRACLRGTEISTEMKYRGKDYLLRLIPVRDRAGEVYAGMAISQNVTKEKKITNGLKKAKKQAEAASRHKSDFLANISHEIRTPLNAIVGFTEQLLKTRLNKRQRNFVETIDNSSEHLLALINDILILSKLEARNIQFEVNPFSLSHTVKHVHALLNFKAEQKHLSFSYTIEPGFDPVLMGDESRLRQILLNLLNNAIKFTDSGSVHLHCSQAGSKDGTIMVKFEVTDTGIGIEEGKLELIFEQFRQADPSVTGKYGGAGLGLSITRSLIDMQGGELTVKSRVGKGSTFTAVIPYIKGTKKELPEGQLIETEKSDLNGIRVLLVDDDSVNRLLAKTILKGFGCKVVLATGGADAIKKSQTAGYDLILLDIMMPDINGVEVARRIRKGKKNATTRIIAVTAAFMKDDMDGYFDAGIDDYLVKPFREINLYNKMIKNLLIRRDSRHLHDKSDDPDNIRKKNTSGYDLSELESMAEGDNEFMAEMLKTFIDNLSESKQRFSQELKNRKWDAISEIAHKMLPSFRHLRSYEVTHDLEEIRVRIKDRKEMKAIPDMVNAVIRKSEVLLDDLTGELERVKKS